VLSMVDTVPSVEFLPMEDSIAESGLMLRRCRYATYTLGVCNVVLPWDRTRMVGDSSSTYVFLSNRMGRVTGGRLLLM
jgi:hypothetical protein